MAQQKALLLMAKHGAFALGKVDIPKPLPGHLLVKVIAAALNPVDWKIQKSGHFLDKFPAVLGEDIAGIVEEVGEHVTAFKKGDRVFHQGIFGNEKAAFQEYVIVPADIVAHMPSNISFDEACSIPLCIGTAAVGFYNPMGCNGAGMTPPWEPSGEGKYKGKGIFIFGGSTSTGQYAIQLARLSGFAPIAVTASPHNSALLTSLGATHVIDRRADVVAEASNIFTTPPGFVFDTISAEDTQEMAWKILARNGTLALVLPVSSKLDAGEDGKTVFSVFGNLHVNRDLGRRLFPNLTGLVESGKIKPNRVEVLPGGLAGIEGGLKRMLENQVSGVKLVVRPQETSEWDV